MIRFGIYLFRFLDLLQWLLVVRAISSWIFMRNPGSPLYQFIITITEPIGPVKYVP